VRVMAGSEPGGPHLKRLVRNTPGGVTG
jgi:hypothetical protein